MQQRSKEILQNNNITFQLLKEKHKYKQSHWKLTSDVKGKLVNVVVVNWIEAYKYLELNLKKLDVFWRDQIKMAFSTVCIEVIPIPKLAHWNVNWF